MRPKYWIYSLVRRYWKRKNISIVSKALAVAIFPLIQWRPCYIRNPILYASMVPRIGLFHNNKHRHSFNGPQINLFLPYILQGKNINFISLLSPIFSHKTFSLITFFPLQRLTTGNFILFCLSLKDISLEYLSVAIGPS